MGKFGTREMLFIDNKMLIYICETKADSIQMSIIALVLSIASELVWPLDGMKFVRAHMTLQQWKILQWGKRWIMLGWLDFNVNI